MWGSLVSGPTVVTWRRGPPRIRLGFKEGGLDFQEVDRAWNGGGWTCKATPTLKLGFHLAVQFGLGGARREQFGFWAFKMDQLNKRSVCWAFVLFDGLSIRLELF
ncbi:hypothetical protein PIB30_013838 [Stylosanthes scabra]|uniref:Uncharacterized protein n=1 Tax=Stylosanthes scabra TaxID=79078 RepID=A0ABU6T671_9FABA|nr:hypothetical protein [Stylosanthes scabra]